MNFKHFQKIVEIKPKTMIYAGELSLWFLLVMNV